jgi:hypothetical protein
MRELHSARFNVVHAYGLVGGERRSMAEIILLTTEPEYLAKFKAKDGKLVSGKIDVGLTVKQYRFIASPRTLRECAEAFIAIADGIEAEFDVLFPEKPEGEAQKSFLDDSPEQPGADAVSDGDQPVV